MKKKNLLLVCLSFRDIDRIAKLSFSKNVNVILASDDLKVHRYCEKLEVIDKIIFLQKSISYISVSASVIKFIKKVNIYFNKINKLGIFSKKEIFWNFHVEGGYTTQKLQDTLLYIESTNIIIDEHKINEVILIGNYNSFLIKILKRVTIKKNCKISFYNHSTSFDWKKIKNFIRPIFFFFRALICKVRSNKPSNIKKNKFILFQIFSASKKHVQNAIFPQKQLIRSNLIPLNIIWGSTKEVKKINEKGYKAISIEYYLRYIDLLISIYKTILVFIKSKIIKDLFYQTGTFIYKGIDIKDIVYDSIFQYLYTDGPENYRYRAAAQRFASEYSKNIVAIKYSGAKALSKGYILSNIFQNKTLKINWWGHYMSQCPYSEFNKKKYNNFFQNTLTFCANHYEKKIVMGNNTNQSKKNFIVIGPGRTNSHFKNLEILSKAKSKREIGIKKNYDIYVLFDFNEPIYGYISAEEGFYSLYTIKRFIEERPNIALIIKPHPSSDVLWLNYFLKGKTGNIYLLDRKLLPDHALNVADVIFTKASTIGHEAMIYDCQVVSTIFDNRKKFKPYGDSAKYIYKNKNLNIFLENSLNSKENFFKWKNSFKKKRINFIKKYYPKLEKSSEEIIEKSILKKLNMN